MLPGTIVDAWVMSASKAGILLSVAKESSIFGEYRKSSTAEWGEECWLKVLLTKFWFPHELNGLDKCLAYFSEHICVF
jgi:hypothetical protein